MKADLKSVKISNFQSLGEDQFVEFSHGLYSIIGKNDDDGGSNGSGKSSLTRAIVVGLLGPNAVDVTVKELRNRLASGPPKVTLTLEADGKTVVVDRTIGGKLTVTVDGKELEGKGDEVQSKLLGVLHCTDEQIAYLTYKAQGSFGGFLLKKDSEKKSFLGSFFELDKMEAASEKVSKEASEVMKTVDVARINIEGVRRSVSDLDLQINDVNAKIAAMTSEEYMKSVVLTHTQLTEARAELTAIDTKRTSMGTKEQALAFLCTQSPDFPKIQDLQAQMETLSAKMTAEVPSLTVKIQELREKIAEPIVVPAELNDIVTAIDQAIAGFHDTMRRKTKISSDLDSCNRQAHQKRVQITGMKVDTCDRCGQQISAQKFNELRESLNADLKAMESEQNALSKALEDLSAFVKGDEINGLNQHKQNALSEIEKFKQANSKAALSTELSLVQSNLNALNTELATIKNQIESVSRMTRMYATSEWDKMVNEAVSLQRTIDSLEQLSKARADQQASLVQSVESLKKRREELVSKTNEAEATLTEKLEEHAVLSKTMEILSKNGFLGYIFDSLLDELNNQLNQNLKLFHVAAKLSLYFTPDKVAKTTGAMSKAISYKIYSGTNEVSFETLSGGEKLSLIMAVDEAMDSILSRRLGVSLNWKIYDEQFFWIDENSKESILEFMREKSYGKTYLIIDHAGEFNASIEKRIVVTKQNGISTVSS